MGTPRQAIPRMTLHEDDEDKDDDEDGEATNTIEWMNIIFLPFNPVFRFVVLVTVLVKLIVSSVEAIYPLNCHVVIDTDIYLYIIKCFYDYFCGVIYAIDTTLHMAHRLADISKQREHPPKPKLYILLDIISLLPIHRLTTSDLCPTIKFWPNVLNMVKIVIVYRIKDYFSLSTTHSLWNIVAGYTLLTVVFTNFITCLFILLTYREIRTGLDSFRDWRKNLIIQIGVQNTEAVRYMNSVFLVISYGLKDLTSDTKPCNVITYYLVALFMLITYMVYTFIAYPKSFVEALLQLKRTFDFFPRVKKIITETRRRSHLPGAHEDVCKFYNLAWRTRGGITSIPDLILEFPRHLRIDIKKDLTWPIFYHSPTLRRVSTPFIHWLADVTHLDYKLPTEIFFAGPNCRSHLFYLKSGIVQLISAEDGTTPLLSLTGGTIFGDINFFLPPAPTANKTVIVRCLTYCEIYFFTRNDILKALHKFPEDRRRIMERIKSKIQHARTLHTCKQHVKGLDRAEDEGIAWIKRRWWELNEAISKWKKATKKSESIFMLPPEEANYRCSKYIGQLVLCPDAQLQRESMFANCQFPWILVPDSNLIRIWQRIVTCTVALVLILYPPFLSLSVRPDYFRYFEAWANIVYIGDISLTLITAIEEQGHLLSNFASVMFKRCKNWTFILNVLATIWLEEIVVIMGKPELYSICQFNKLIKVYIVFFKSYVIEDVRSDPGLMIYQPIFLLLSYTYVSGYFVLSLTKLIPQLNIRYFFDRSLCGNEDFCDPSPFKLFSAVFTWTFRDIYVKTWPNTLLELAVRVVLDYLNLILVAYCAGRMIMVIYLKNLNDANYLFITTHLKYRFKRQNVHPEIWNRLVKYVVCYWRQNRHLEMGDTSLLRFEPYDIYWKAHGEIASNIITMCKAFVGANPNLIKELAHIAKFTILPKNSTILLTGVTVKDVCWLVNGDVMKEYQKESGTSTEIMHGPAATLISCSAVFFGKPSLVTCTSLTECEMLCISTVDFFRIINQYPQERFHIRTCTEKFRSSFNDLLKVNTAIKKVDSWNEIGKPSEAKIKFLSGYKEMPKSNWRNPRSKFTQYWMALRAFSVAVSIIAASLEGGSLAAHRRVLMPINGICSCFTLVDIFVKSFAAYYNEDGLLIYSKLKCMVHYFTRGLILDIVAIIPWYILPTVAPINIAEDTALLINAVSKYARVHLLLGYFDYLANSPLAWVTAILLLKWQVFSIFLMFLTSHYLIVECAVFQWDDSFALTSIEKRPGCWLPSYIQFDNAPSPRQVDLLIGQSYSVAQCAFLRISYGLFNVKGTDYLLGILIYSVTVVYWCIFCYSLAILMLSRRNSTLFQHAFSSLDKFLNAERLDETLIKRSLAFFSYWWIRTNGVNIFDNFIHNRVSSMFSQDIIHFFHKQTFTGLDLLLKGGEQMMKQLSCVGFQMHLLPNVPVMREMDLNPWVFIVHRGEVVIKKEGKNLAFLKKGSIFGQLEGTGPVPVRVSAYTTIYTDILRIPVGAFQENIDDKTRFTINRHPTAALDYMEVKEPPKENPYNSIKYFLRGGKTIHLPWMKEHVKAHTNRKYNWWLAFVWLVGPYISAAIVIILNTLPLEMIHKLMAALVILDFVHLAHFMAEFYTVELVIIDDECVNRHIHLRKFKEWRTYLDIASLVLPIMTAGTHNWGFQLARLLRLHNFYDFYKYFCKDFKSQRFHNVIDFAVISLMVEMMVCGWVVISCRPSVLEDSYYIPKHDPTLDKYEKYFNEWIHPIIRGEGCKTIVYDNNPKTSGKYSFLVPIRWQDDYAIALGFILSLITGTNSGNYAALNLKEMYYICLVCYISHFICIWISNSAIREVYLTYRELINFDYNSMNLFSYLKHNGLNESLLERVRQYTALLWQRQRGNWIPELVLEAPLCLKEDLYTALYWYHLQDIPLFKALPVYFTRQLVTRLRRVVIFAGRELIQEGDVFACIYFIHDGEVEKWTTDSNGERKMIALLSTNGFFGLISGLFPDTPVPFTFVARTIVDVVFLRNRDWQDLREGYPDIKRDLYAAARHLKKDLGKPY